MMPKEEMDKLYKYELNNEFFQTSILQFISGKEYTFTIEDRKSVFDIFCDYF